MRLKFPNFEVAVRRVETAALVSIFLAMLGVAAYQVVARNTFGGGVLWGDDLVRMAVLWVAMVGGVIAARNNEHIRIDLLTRFIPPRHEIWLERVIALITAAICSVLGWVSIEFIRWEMLDNTRGVGAVPAWIFELIIPIGAFLMAFRYLLLAWLGKTE